MREGDRCGTFEFDASCVSGKRVGYRYDGLETRGSSPDQDLGYPVVVKPLDSAMSKGVSVGLTGPDEIPSAFKRASRRGSGVVVESFVEGQDHRILVVGGQFIAAAKRIPPFVTGNGSKPSRP